MFTALIDFTPESEYSILDESSGVFSESHHCDDFKAGLSKIGTKYYNIHIGPYIYDACEIRINVSYFWTASSTFMVYYNDQIIYSHDV